MNQKKVVIDGEELNQWKAGLRRPNVLILTGAGFGKPMGLPTTNEFTKLIDSTIGVGDLPTMLKAYLGQDYYDIEHLMACLETFAKSKSLLKALIGKAGSNYYAVNNFLGNDQSIANSFLRHLKTSLWEILNDYNADIATSIYINVLSEITTLAPNAIISLFTTNYDLTFEENFHGMLEPLYKLGIDEVDYGFSYLGQRNIWNPTKKFEKRPNILEYKKLHGSLDWITSKNEILRSGYSAIPTDPDKMLLLFPGFKGTPINEPFRTLHNDLFDRLFNSHLVIVIGFAFRDEYISNIFEAVLRINSKVQVICYNPIKFETLPKDSKMVTFAKNYNNFYYACHPISPDPNPLNLHDILKSI
jgi:hypothetical protein